MFALTILSAALLASQVSANAILGRSPLASLLRVRQTSSFDPSDIPSECSVQCATTSEVLGGTSCQTTSCLCTPQVNIGFQQCLQCLIDLAGGTPSLITQSQDAIAEYEDACKSAGVPLSSLTISAATSVTGSASISLPSGSASASSRGSVFFTSTSANGGTLSTDSPRATSSRAVITAVSSADNTTPTSTTAGDGDNATSGSSNNGASVTVAGLSTVALTGIAGALVLLGL